MTKTKRNPSPSLTSHAAHVPSNPSAEYFSKLSDEDFFSDRVQHLYMYDRVNDETVHQLQQDIHNANKSMTLNDVQVSPKPIVLHVNSPGGSMTSCMSMITIFNQTRVPLCTMTDGYSCSAASYLTIASPYRVAASSHVFTLIHQGTLSLIDITEEQLTSLVTSLGIQDESMRAIYLECTKLKQEQLRELMLRDLFLDTSFCTRYGIYDRVLDVKNGPALSNYKKQRAEYVDLPLHVLLSKSNWNRFVFSTCKGDVQRLDAILSAPAADTKPVIYYCTPRCYHAPFYWLAMVARMKAMRVPVYSVIESVVTIWDYLPSLFCMKRYMYAHGMIDIDLQYDLSYGPRLQDIRDNTISMLTVLRTILRQKTSIPEVILKDIGEKRYSFTAQQCLEYRLCDEVVPLHLHR